jgi:hypothetical protein
MDLKYIRAARELILKIIDFFYPPFRKWIPLQTFRYLACGGGVTVLGLVVYFLAYNFLLDGDFIRVGGLTITRYIAAYIISFFIAFPTGFFLSKFVVFSDSDLKGRIQLFRYGVLQVLNIGLNWSFLHLFAGYLGFWATPSQALTSIILAVFSYFFQRYVSFQIRKDGSMDISLNASENEEEIAL